MQSAHERLVRFVSERGFTKAELGRRLGCTASHAGYLLSGLRKPGLKVLHPIETLTSDWVDGPIKTEEWANATEAA